MQPVLFMEEASFLASNDEVTWKVTPRGFAHYFSLCSVDSLDIDADLDCSLEHLFAKARCQV